MTKFAKTTLVASALALAAGSVSAATVTQVDRFVSGGEDGFNRIAFQNSATPADTLRDGVSSGTLFGLSFRFDTDFGDVPDLDGDGDADVVQYLTFSIDQDFRLELRDYDPDLSSANSSGLFIDSIMDGMATRLTSMGNCDVSVGMLSNGANVDGPCTRVSSDDPDFMSPNGGIAPIYQFGLFEAGTYRIGIYEGNEAPTFGNVDFRLAAVPVPAAGFMLLAGLGGLAAARRRKG